MIKRITALFIAFFVLLSTTTLAARKDLNESYNKNLTIGLKNMVSSSINITLNGDYTADGQAFSSGSKYTLALAGGKINFNSRQYDEITFTPGSNAGTLTLEVPKKKYSFIGAITFRAMPDGSILPVNSVDIESYLKGVVGYEMSNSYPVEALKAQAVAARNYALANIGKYSSQGFDLSDGTDCQVYRGYNSAYSNVNAAVDGTKGIVLTYNDSLVSGFYSASNGGYIESSKNAWSSDIPYLQVKQDDFDNTDWPYGDRKFTTADIDKTLKDKGIITIQDNFIRLNIDTIQRNDSTRIASIDVVYTDVTGAELTKSITKEKARTFLSLPSSLYNVTYDAAADTYTFSGKGYGHGIGLSQTGAKNRAAAGQKYDEILTFYYPGSQVKRIGDITEGFSLSKYDTFVGDTVSFTAKTAASSTTLFKYTVELDGNVIFTRDYSSNPNADYKVDRAGYLTVHLYTKDVNSNKEYDEQKILSFTAINLLEITDVNFSAENPVVNKPVTISMDIQGSSAAGVEYKVEAEKDHVVYFSKTSDASSFEFVPPMSGEYTIFAMIKEKGSNNYSDMETLSLKVMPETNPLPSAPPPTSSQFSITRNLQKGVSGNDVKSLQEALKKLGYYTYGSITNYFGDVTKKAVVDFQSKNKLTPNGIVDKNTAAAINSALAVKSSTSSGTTVPSSSSGSAVEVFSTSRMLKAGVSGNDVKQLQEILKKMGYYTYPTITGYYGTVTENAVKAFQKANGMIQSGIVDEAVVKKINEKMK